MKILTRIELENIKNLDDAVNVIFDHLSNHDIDYIIKKDLYCEHSYLGRHIRNSLHLWDQDNHLIEWFRFNLGVSHPDDVSALILGKLWAKVRNQEFDIGLEVEKIQLHWQKLGVNQS